MPAYIHKPTIVHAYPTRVRNIIHTLEGDIVAEVGDYIVHGDHGERWPVKPKIFFESYEPIASSMWANDPRLKAAYTHKPTLVHAYPTAIPMTIHKSEGDMVAEVGDYIVHGDHGERWPVKPKIFLESYDPIASMSKDDPRLKAVGLA